jgi:hypothetical protein
MLRARERERVRRVDVELKTTGRRGPLWRGRALILALVCVASIALGFLLTYPGVATWDSRSHLDRSLWLVHQLGLPSSRASDDLNAHLRWYGPFWVSILGVLSEEVFRFLRDPSWVQQAFTFALFPLGLVGIYRLLVRAGVSRSTAALAAALTFGMIRLGGHALLNVNDFPFAMAYLLVTLYTWNKLRELHAAALVDHRYRAGSLILLGVVSIVPYLIRPPVCAHVLIVSGFLYLCGRFVLKTPRRIDRLAMAFLPLSSALALMWLIWPPLRADGGWGWSGWLGSFGDFARFSMVGRVRIFGRFLAADRLPWWYPFAWIPVILNPLALAAFVAGMLNHLRRPSLAPQSFVLDAGGRRRPFDLSLRRWLVLLTVLPWVAVLLVRPVLYDEERHLLFLYPPLLILAALGLDNLSARLKVGLAALIVVASLHSYAHWGRYAYVYKSPIIRDRVAHRFTGDYWGVCVPLAVTALKDFVPPDAEVVVPVPYDAALLQYDRLRTGRFSGLAGYGPYRLETSTKSARYYAILYNRMGFNDRAIDADRAGKAKILWRAIMPPADPACVLVEYSGAPSTDGHALAPW